MSRCRGGRGGGDGRSARILFRASGPAVDATGLGPGFSGSPIYCPDAAGVSRNIGAVSESINEYGGKIALATPIESILGTPVDVPRRAPRRGCARRWRGEADGVAADGQRAERAAGQCAGSRRARGRAARARRASWAAGAFPVQTLRPGSAVAVGYSSGTCATSAVGTVAYVDGDRVWVFGHQLEGVGRRALLLQDAYVFRMVNNPLQLAADRRPPTSSRPPGMTWHGHLGRLRRGRGRRPAAAHGARARDRARHGQQRRQAVTRRGRRGRGRPPERRLVDVVRRAARRRQAPAPCSAARPAACRRDVRADLPRGALQAGALL